MIRFKMLDIGLKNQRRIQGRENLVYYIGNHCSMTGVSPIYKKLWIHHFTRNTIDTGDYLGGWLSHLNRWKQKDFENKYPGLVRTKNKYSDNILALKELKINIFTELCSPKSDYVHYWWVNITIKLFGVLILGCILF